jgi:hypothetical protein
MAKKTLLQRIFSNRRDDKAKRCSVMDLMENTSDQWHIFTKRIPMGSYIKRDGKGKYAGYVRRVE